MMTMTYERSEKRKVTFSERKVTFSERTVTFSEQYPHGDMGVLLSLFAKVT